MIRRLLLGASIVVATLTIATGTANACCEQTFSRTVTTPYGSTYYDQKAGAEFHIPGYAAPYEAARVKERIRNYADKAVIASKSYCQSHPRICKAAAACIVAGGAAYNASGAWNGYGSRVAIRDGINACVSAAVAALVFG